MMPSFVPVAQPWNVQIVVAVGTVVIVLLKFLSVLKLLASALNVAGHSRLP